MIQEITQNRAILDLPVSIGMELLRNVTALYQNGLIVRGEKDFMAEQIESSLKTGDYTLLYRYVLTKVPTATADNPFYDNMKKLMEQEE